MTPDVAEQRLTVALRFAESDENEFLVCCRHSDCHLDGDDDCHCLIAEAAFDAAPTLDELLRGER